MNIAELIDRVVSDGIEAASCDYEAESEKLRGSVAGFEACRGKTPEQLAALVAEARRETHQAYVAQADDYWYWRCREAEIEWTCNVVSAVLMNEGLPVILAPTARGALKAAEIVGVG